MHAFLGRPEATDRLTEEKGPGAAGGGAGDGGDATMAKDAGCPLSWKVKDPPLRPREAPCPADTCIPTLWYQVWTSFQSVVLIVESQKLVCCGRTT